MTFDEIRPYLTRKGALFKNLLRAFACDPEELLVVLRDAESRDEIYRSGCGNSLRFHLSPDAEERAQMQRDVVERQVSTMSPIVEVLEDRNFRKYLSSKGVPLPRASELLTLERAQAIAQEFLDAMPPLHPTLPALAKGDTEVWYYKSGRDLGMGYDFCKEHGLLPDPTDLTKTHALLGMVASEDPETLFEMLQGENWGRGEETNAILREKGLRHTSMSVGDILVIEGRVLMCDRDGFVELGKEASAETRPDLL